MKHLAIGAFLAFASATASPATAEMFAGEFEDGDKIIISEVSDTKVSWCYRAQKWPIFWCWQSKADTRNGVVKWKDLSRDGNWNFRLKMSEAVELQSRGPQVTDQRKASISASDYTLGGFLYEGKWNTGENTSLQLTRRDRVRYCYDGSCSTQKVTLDGVAKMGTYLLVPTSATEIVIVNHSKKGTFVASLKGEPALVVGSVALGAESCSQALLKRAGHLDGTVDGILGRGSRTAGEKYVSETGQKLPTLTNKTAGQWCDHLQKTVEVDPTELLELLQ